MGGAARRLSATRGVPGVCAGVPATGMIAASPAAAAAAGVAAPMAAVGAAVGAARMRACDARIAVRKRRGGKRAAEQKAGGGKQQGRCAPSRSLR